MKREAETPFRMIHLALRLKPDSSVLPVMRIERVRQRRTPAWIALLLFAVVPLGQRGQSGHPVDIPAGNTPINVGPKIAGDTSDYLYGVDPDFHHRMLTARRDEQKKRMMENASRLLEITRQLDNDLQGHEPTQADAKRLDDIAKLARAVRDQMRQ